MMAKIMDVTVFALILDGGWFVRCDGCGHPARVVPSEPRACPVCGRPGLLDCPRTTVDVYRASRADDAPIPFVERWP